MGDGCLGKIEYFIVIMEKASSSRAGQDIVFVVDFSRNTVPIRLQGRCNTASTWIPTGPRLEQGTRQVQRERIVSVFTTFLVFPIELLGCDI
ncbi:hypothetical protein P5673_032596 [Acropora cervicornis]|uniref:Uncharacterized protein n=1 Tax=Acropora cervicornis TaxID=6130 RepID=A0AAD9URW2_ACRCE|nr:hypothetical protein P5673_032596 [Acropora cervicornis]